uniref:Uncharacterized protein n=1 Tax=Arundo donax TaxID=35708 RepID=A0A0A9DYC6_ARUDO
MMEAIFVRIMIFLKSIYVRSNTDHLHPSISWRVA